MEPWSAERREEERGHIRQRLDDLSSTVTSAAQRNDTQHAALALKVDTVREMVHDIQTDLAVHLGGPGHPASLARLHDVEADVAAQGSMLASHARGWWLIRGLAGLLIAIAIAVLGAWLQVRWPWG